MWWYLQEQQTAEAKPVTMPPIASGLASEMSFLPVLSWNAINMWRETVTKGDLRTLRTVPEPELSVSEPIIPQVDGSSHVPISA